jgi:hypothetical protein
VILNSRRFSNEKAEAKEKPKAMILNARGFQIRRLRLRRSSKL